MTAEEFFEWARSCATKRASAVAVRKHLYDKRSSSPLVSSGSGGDPMAYIDSAMDREREIDAEIARYDAIQRRAMLVIQEVYKYVPGPAGAILELYYIHMADTWSEVAEELHISNSTLYRVRGQAMAWVDYIGIVDDIRLQDLQR